MISETNRFVWEPSEEEIAECKRLTRERREHPERYPELTTAEITRRQMIRLTAQGLYDGPIPDPEPQYADKKSLA
jgi:hypothetical protein